MDKQIQYRGLGRRKSAVARVIIRKGSGKVTINKREAKAYLMKDIFIETLKSPLKVTETEKDFDVFVNVRGGGLAGQTDAIRLGIARALMEASSDYRATLKKEGLLTRDSRVKERKKPGLRKARRARQFSKR